MPELSRSWNPGLRPALIALPSGFLLALAFPPFNIWPIVFIALLPLWYFASRLTPGKAFMAGWLLGIGLYLGSMYWLCYVMVNFGGLPWPLAIVVLLLFCLYLGLYYALTTYLAGRLLLLKIPLWLSVPLLWLGLEYLRGIALTGFPWLPLSLSLSSFPPLLQSAAWWGALGVSACIVLVSVLLAYVCKLAGSLAWPPRIVCGLLALLMLAGGTGLGQLAVINMETQPQPLARLSVVQANIGLDRLWKRDLRGQNVMQQITLTRKAAAQAAQMNVQQPWLVLWSESAAPFAFLYDMESSAPILRTARDVNAFLAIGTTGFIEADGQMKHANRMYMINPDGQPADFYDKVHLVPFGEYVPLAKVLFFVRAIAALSIDMAPGQAGKLLAADEIEAGPLICYESIFPELARAHRLNGANLLLNPTNDAWFGPTGASSQHLGHLVLRAVENRISCVRAANTGISCFIMPNGRVLQETALFNSDVRTQELPLWQEATFYSKYGDMIDQGGLIVLSLALVYIIIASRRSRNGNTK